MESAMPSARPAMPSRTATRPGVGRVLIAVYAVLALAASGRSFYQLVAKFDQAPLAYSLSALAAVVYIAATVALIVPGPRAHRVATITITFELVGVLVVGLLSLVAPSLFAHPSVWSWFGAGYLFIPLIMPILGLLWLRRTATAAQAPASILPDTQHWAGLDDVPEDLGPTAVTVGKFDGVHLGHLAILRDLRQLALEAQLATVAVTFDRHPAALFAPESAPADITGLAKRVELLSEAGVDATLVLPFTHELADYSPRKFVSDILVDTLHAQVVLVGHDFRFGAKASGDVGLLRTLGDEFGFSVVEVDDVSCASGERVSSSRVRDMLLAGDVAGATEQLGRYPSVRGEVVHGAKRGRELGFPTANLSHDATGLIPADGVYAGWVTVNDERYPAAISVGTNPTFESGAERTVEAHLLAVTIDLYGQILEVDFVSHLRPMVAYTGVDALIEQMRLDCDEARNVLGEAHA
jgi:riboflavin kinase/FMN adenylyltransferase